MSTILLALAQAALLVAIAPLVNGIVRKVKATLQGRRGPSVLQPYFDLRKTFAKESIVSEDASWLFRAAPVVSFTAMAVATLLLPVLWVRPPSGGFLGDAILFVYLLGLARFFVLLAAMDTGSAFTGMGSSRDATLSALAEPAILLALLLVGLASGSLDLGAMTGVSLQEGLASSIPMRVLTLVGLVVIVIVEAGRVPIDNPATHLELTMIHEGLILEHSGKQLALLTWASAIKQVLLLTLLVDLFLPWGLATQANLATLAVSCLAFLGKLLGLAVAIGVLESVVAKMRLFQVPDLIGASYAFSALALIAFAVGG